MNSVPLAGCMGIGSAVIGVIAAVLHPEQPGSVLLTVSLSTLWIILLLVMSGKVR